MNYDSIGNITSLVDNLQGANTQTFTYDHLNRLKTAVSPAISGEIDSNYNFVYNYDQIGNIDSLTDNGTFIDYSYDPNKVHAVTSVGSDTFSYDGNGNMTTRAEGGTFYTQIFDKENRLETVTNTTVIPNETSQFFYDASGQRTKTVQPDGTVIYYPFPNFEEEVRLDGHLWQFDEGSGDTVSDSAGIRHGERVGATWVAGHSGQALDFDGVGDRVKFDAEPAISGAMTVSAWVKPEQAPTVSGRLIASTYKWNSDATKQRGWLLGRSYGSDDILLFRVYDDNGNGGYALYNGFFNQYLNQWVHVTGVYKPGEAVQLYINGILVNEDTVDVPTKIGYSSLFKIGARADNTTQGFWDGQIDELQIVAYAMDASEVSGLVGHLWRFDEGSGDTVSDSAGIRHGERVGATWVAGHSGQALDFDGVDDRVTFDAEPAISGAMTVSAWVKPEQAPTGLGRVVVSTYDWDSDPTKQRGWMFGRSHGSDDLFLFRVYDDNGQDSLAGYSGFFNKYINLNQWVHVVGVFKPGEAVQLYVNGILVSEDTTDVPTAISSSGLFKIGMRADNNTQGQWDGQIDELQIVAYAMDAGEVSGLFAGSTTAATTANSVMPMQSEESPLLSSNAAINLRTILAEQGFMLLVGSMILMTLYMLLRLYPLRSWVMRVQLPVHGWTLFVLGGVVLLLLGITQLARATDVVDEASLLQPQPVAAGAYLPAAAPVSSPWASVDIGSVGLAGSSDLTGSVYTVDGSGGDISGTADQFHYLYQPLSGDGEIVVQITSQTNTNSRAKSGVMLRETLTADSAHMTIATTPANWLYSLDRTSSGGTTGPFKSPNLGVPRWLRLERVGNVVTTYHSSDGQSWTLHDTATFTMATDVYIGMAVTAYDNAQLSSATFTDVTVTGGSNPTATPTPVSSATSTTIASTTPTATLVVSATATSTLSASPTSTLVATATATEESSPTSTPATGGDRVTDGIQVLYTFYEGSGSDVHDVSGVGTPLDLTIADTAAVVWPVAGGLEVNTGSATTIIESSGAATKLIDAAIASNEISIEVWIAPDNVTQDGPARIVTLSGDKSNRNMMLGQGYSGSTAADLFNARLRTTTNNNNGSNPSVLTSSGTATTSLMHVVYTRDSGGTVTMYIDGVEVTVDEPLIDGDLSNWDSGYKLALADEFNSTSGRSWAGTYQLVAIYSKALSAAEVSQNYTAGELQPTPTATPLATETATPLPTATETALPTETPTATPPPADPPPDPIVIQRVTYAIAGQPIAMRVSGDPVTANNGLHYLYSDHLSSNSAMQAPNGDITRTRYEPFGAYRGGSGGNAITDRGYTGHKQNDSLGLIYMNARFYVPGIARFASADTIVPDPMNPQNFNRFSYVRNNPINLIDPTGHRECGGPYDSACSTSKPGREDTGLNKLRGGKYDLTNWLAEEMTNNATGSDMLEIQELRSGNLIQQMLGVVPFFNLNTNTGRWNFKEETSDILNSGMIVLCGLEQCGWFDYSTPGNIHYGYMAAAAGVRETASMIAGGALEAWDGIFNGLQYFNENPEDWEAVELGYALYDLFGVDMTPEQLMIGVDVYWDRLQRPDPRLIRPADAVFPPENPYTLGAFDYAE